jgi:hypothetical protein
MIAMKTRKNIDGDAIVLMALMFLCCFLLFGMSVLPWIFTRHWVNVWQGSCQAMGGWRNSHYGTKGRKIAKQISGKGGGLCFFNM